MVRTAVITPIIIGIMGMTIGYSLANEGEDAVDNANQKQNDGSRAFIKINANKIAHPASPLLYGIFFEEINHAGDGGLYAEMVRNRSFEDVLPPEGCTVSNGELLTPYGWRTKFDDSDPMPGWKLDVKEPAIGLPQLDDQVTINSSNPLSLRLETDCSRGGSVSMVNYGYWGMCVDRGAAYKLSLFAKNGGPKATSILVSLQGADGREYARHRITNITDKWAQHHCILVSSESDKNARLVITTTDTGVLWLDFVSLFPEATWKRRDNGWRHDLMQMLVDMKPKFMRFPGGCFVEGISPETAYRWKNTIGPIEERKSHWNLWGYRTTNGLGFHEYLQMCEDLGAEPIYVCNCGMTCQARMGGALPIDQLSDWIQDALDALEYANGPADRGWGAVRASANHPRPFNMKFLEIGNENSGPDYEERYRLFYDAIKKQYPDVHLIADVPVPNAKLDIVDEHYYSNPAFFMRAWDKYDSYNRKGPKIYVGEYAVTEDCGRGNLRAALAEGMFMCGMERNSDVVTMCSYAPLFVNLNSGAWYPDAICFDNSSCYGNPSYHAQVMFSQNQLDEVLSYESNGPAIDRPFPTKGGIGLSTWHTDAEFKDIKVTQGEKVLYTDDFTSKAEGWMPLRGEWTVVDGAYRQTTHEPNTLALLENHEWDNYTLSLKARKLGGNEGFLIFIRTENEDNCIRWNIGGWGNTLHGINIRYKGRETTSTHMTPGSVETGKWYDILIDVNGRRVTCSLDGNKIFDFEITPIPLFNVVAGKDTKTDEIIIKAVNASESALTTDIQIDSSHKIGPTGTEIVLASNNSDDENSLAEPKKVFPYTHSVEGFSNKFIWTFKPYSITILRLSQK